MGTIKVFLSESTSPYLNLATEEWIFHNLDPEAQVLFLWRNEETVVIGRNQNPWAECNLAKMKEDGVHLARRTTGGGAVFHDLGNTNFTFLSPKAGYRRENNIAVILNALGTFGVEGQASGRNDLILPGPRGPQKFSGSAYREKSDRAFHHGTLLLHADLARLSQYLTPHPKKLKAKGKESVRARVMNLGEVVPSLTHEQVVEACVQSFERFYGGAAERETLSLESLRAIPALAGQYDRLSSFDWLYGHTLEFDQRLEEYLSLGFFDFHLKVERARITGVQIFSDCLYPVLVDELAEALRGVPFTGRGVDEALEKAAATHPELAAGLEEMRLWLRTQVKFKIASIPSRGASRKGELTMPGDL